MMLAIVMLMAVNIKEFPERWIVIMVSVVIAVMTVVGTMLVIMVMMK